MCLCDNKKQNFLQPEFCSIRLCRVYIYLNFHWLALLLSTEITNVHWLPPLAIVHCGVLTIDHVSSSVTAVCHRWANIVEQSA